MDFNIIDRYQVGGYFVFGFEAYSVPQRSIQCISSHRYDCPLRQFMSIAQNSMNFVLSFIASSLKFYIVSHTMFYIVKNSRLSHSMFSSAFSLMTNMAHQIGNPCIFPSQ